MSMEFVLGLAVGILFTAIVLRVLLWWTARRLEARLESLLQAHQTLVDQTMLVRLEQLDDTYFVYDMKTDAFMAQGKSAQEVKERLKQVYGKYTVTVAEGDDHVLAKFKQELDSISG